MNGIESNSLSATQSEGNFLIGDKLTLKQAQDMIDAGQGENVYESKYGQYHKKEWLDGQHSLLNRVGAKAAQSGNSTNSGMSYVAEPTLIEPWPVTRPLPFPGPELGRLAGDLESAAFDLTVKYDNNAAVVAFSDAADEVSKAALKVEANPTSQAAIEDLETAVDMLRNKAHALEGSIDDKQYTKIALAVDKFEQSTDHMLAADAGGDMARAMSNSSDALASLVAATGGQVSPGIGAPPPPPDTSDGSVAEAYSQLNDLSADLNSMVNALLDKYGILNNPIQDATEDLEDAVDVFNTNPTDKQAIKGLLDAINGSEEKIGLVQGINGLEGIVDESTFIGLSKAVKPLSDNVNKLSGLVDQQAEMDSTVSDIVNSLKNLLDVMSANKGEGPEIAEQPAELDSDEKTLEMLNKILAYLENQKTDDLQSPMPPETSSENRIKDNLKPKTVADMQDAMDNLASFSRGLGDHYDIPELNTFSMAAAELAEAGHKMLEDPTAANIKLFQDKADALVTAKDKLGGKIDPEVFKNVDTAVNKFETAIDYAVTHYEDGDTEQFNEQITIAANSMNSVVDIAKEAFIGVLADTVKDILKPKTVAGMQDAVDNLASFSNGLGDHYDIPELNTFSTAAAELAEAGHKMLEDPTAANIKLFQDKADALVTAKDKLGGKIDPEVFKNVDTAVNKFETAIDYAVTHYEDGDTEQFNEQITIAANSMNSVADIAKEAFIGVQADTVKDILKPKTVAGMQDAVDNLASFSNGLGDHYDIPELNTFSTAAAELAEAGHKMLEDPTAANIKLFQDKADALVTAKDELGGKIDPEVFKNVDTAVNKFETAIDYAVTHYEDGDTEQFNEQITIAANSMNSVVDIAKEAFIGMPIGHIEEILKPAPTEGGSEIEFDDDDQREDV